MNASIENQIEARHVEEEISAAKLPKRVLTTTLKVQGQKELRAWVTGRGFKEHDDNLKGVLLLRGVVPIHIHRMCWLRLAAELVLAGQNVRCIDAHDLIAMPEDVQLDHIEHLFVDGFHYTDEEHSPFAPGERHMLRARIQKWMEGGRAVYPYTDAPDSNIPKFWYGGSFMDNLLNYVFVFATAPVR